VTTSKRAPQAPNIPTLAEAATVVRMPNYEATAWFGLFAPAGTPKDIIARINAATNEVLKKPEVIKFMHDGGAVPAGGTPQDLAKHVASELARWKAVIEQAGITKQ
jgi:tripartite-type tricarboxylate transporter receptor subunit TctC